MKKFLLICGSLAAFLLLAGALGLFAVYQWAAHDLPDFKVLSDYKPPLVTTVYDRSGGVLGYFYREMRFLVKLDQIPPHVGRAFLAAEDAGFYHHEGVDLPAIFRAALANLRAGHIKQGGSTITQQVIKRMLLTSEKSIERKLKEAILAYRLEKFLSKDEILTIYLNDIYLGDGAYGVEAAARGYFGCHVSDLTLAQAAILAGLPQAPSRYNPYRHMDAAKARQRYVLDRMLELNWITPEEHEKALSEPIVLKSMVDPSWGQGAWYLEEVRRWAVERYGEEAVLAGGLHIRTACDMTHQIAAESSLRKGLIDSAKRRGWTGPVKKLKPEEFESFLAEEAVSPDILAPGEWLKVLVTKVTPAGAEVRFGEYKGVIDVASVHWARAPDPRKATEQVASVKDATLVLARGDVVYASVIAVPQAGAKGVWQLDLEIEPEVEGALVSLETATGDVRALVGGYDFNRSQFNRATQARRQPGSAFKPIVYCAALDAGFTPASVVLDAPIVYTDTARDDLWKPENYEGVFYGPTILRTALAKSRNLCTIRVAQKIGIRAVVERAKALGLDGEFNENLSVALGSVEVSLMNLCRAYSAFARGGSYIEPRLVTEVVDAWGQQLYLAEPAAVEAVSPQTAYVITAMMEEVVRDGTGQRAKELGRPVAGKTGTTNDERDAWFMGFTPQLVSGVYVGFDDHRAMGRNETGSRAASIIWVDYRKQIEAQYPYQDFPKPPGITFARIDGDNGLLAGPSTEVSYFLPFKNGTEPSEISAGQTELGGVKATGEDLFKQVF
jgi:penicillin-binding protein 1A